jgi:hypothetical protein
MEDKTAANKSFYQHMIYVCGICFGGNQIYFLKTNIPQFSDINLKNIVGYVFALVILLSLVAKKRMHMVKEDDLVALARPYPHILADWLCSIGLASFLTLGIYILSSDEPFRLGWHNKYESILLLQFLALILGLYLLSYYSKIERRLPVKKAPARSRSSKKDTTNA